LGGSEAYSLLAYADRLLIAESPAVRHCLLRPARATFRPHPSKHASYPQILSTRLFLRPDKIKARLTRRAPPVRTDRFRDSVCRTTRRRIPLIRRKFLRRQNPPSDTYRDRSQPASSPDSPHPSLPPAVAPGQRLHVQHLDAD